jgi:hypothetical protein
LRFTSHEGKTTMRVPLAGVVILLAGGCAGNPEPVQLSGPVPATSSQALNCVGNELTRLGYAVDPMPAGATSVRGTHVTEQPWWRRILGFDDTTDQITASASGGQLQVTAVSSDPDAPSNTAVQGTPTTSGAARADAQQVMRSCAA